MDPDRPQPHHSITLPRSFMFHYRDAQPPRTPEPEAQLDDPQPPPPPRAAMRVRRRPRQSAHEFELDDENEPAGFLPIPTIEAPEQHSEAPSGFRLDESMPEDFEHLQPDLLDSGYLSPVNRVMSSPKTPPSQMRPLGGMHNPQHWDETEGDHSETSSRPTSSSGLSDWSVSSSDSFASFPSLSRRNTSPGIDNTDRSSFSYAGRLASPLSAQTPRIPRKKIVLRTPFTEEMDSHLWRTYWTYLQDPTVTPFKALPGVVPPNGICHRVARVARKTWKGPRAMSPPINTGRSAARFSRCRTPETTKPDRAGNSTPGPSQSYLRFPSEKHCRKRLRDIARSQPSLSAHYLRLLRQRSPSPVPASPQDEKLAPPNLSSPFSAEGPTFFTRDMNVSLATSTASSMQFGNPLSQLTCEATPRPSEKSWPEARTFAHQKSQSLHVGLGLGIGNVLGSSFRRMSEMTDESITQHKNANTWHAQPRQSPKLGSPLKLHAPRPISRPSFKRRPIQNWEELVRNRTNFVEEVFGAPAESSHRGVRSRGFSLGDTMDGARMLGLSHEYESSPPISLMEKRARSKAIRSTWYKKPTSNNAPQQHVPQQHVPQQRMPQQHVPQQLTPQHSFNESHSTMGHSSEVKPPIRLGSPFKVTTPFPRAARPTFEAPTSFEQRFAGEPTYPGYVRRF